MISRYQIKEIEDIFSLESRYNYFLKVELAVIKAYVTIGLIPNEDYLKIKEKAKVDVNLIMSCELASAPITHSASGVWIFNVGVIFSSLEQADKTINNHMVGKKNAIFFMCIKIKNEKKAVSERIYNLFLKAAFFIILLRN